MRETVRNCSIGVLIGLVLIFSLLKFGWWIKYVNFYMNLPVSVTFYDINFDLTFENFGCLLPHLELSLGLNTSIPRDQICIIIFTRFLSLSFSKKNLTHLVFHKIMISINSLFLFWINTFSSAPFSLFWHSSNNLIVQFCLSAV
jgi:hypothetical protein